MAHTLMKLPDIYHPLIPIVIHSVSVTHLFPFRRDFQVEHIFADKVQVKSWNVFGLPDNRFAIESAVILQLSRMICKLQMKTL